MNWQGDLEMELKARKISINHSNPYEKDTMSRENDIENISILLRNIKSPVVVSIDAPWGFGKTTFLEMLHANLEEKQCNCVCFSAWETDFASEPLLAFLGEINQEITSLIGEDSNKTEAWNKVKKAGSHIIKKGVPAIIRVGTAGVLDINSVLGEEISSLSGSLSGDLIEQYSKNKDAIGEFKSSLRDILQDENGTFKNLYIFVDELDRCRPNYALELLERIKHLFDIEGLIFVLALDTRQLSHSVRAVYGSEFDSKGYLKRFIDVEYSLRSAELGDFIDGLYKEFGFDDFFEARRKYPDFEGDRENLRETFKLIAEIQGYSLRDVEQLISRTNLVLHATSERTFIYPALLAFLIMTKESNRDAYLDFIKPESLPDKIIEYLHSIVPKQKLVSSFQCALIEAQIFSAKGWPSGEKVSAVYEKYLQHHESGGGPNDIRGYGSWVIDIVSSPSGIRNGVHLQGLVDRIELLQKFKFSETES